MKQQLEKNQQIDVDMPELEKRKKCKYIIIKYLFKIYI